MSLVKIHPSEEIYENYFTSFLNASLIQPVFEAKTKFLSVRNSFEEKSGSFRNQNHE